jgi:Angiotensin-converting enzyme
MQYTSQPFIYRESPNPSFHEAVAHAVGLNVGGPVHLQKIGLLSSPISTSSGNSMINIEYLLNVALDKLPFMAFSLAVEKVKQADKRHGKHANHRHPSTGLDGKGSCLLDGRSRSTLDAH